METQQQYQCSSSQSVTLIARQAHTAAGTGQVRQLLVEESWLGDRRSFYRMVMMMMIVVVMMVVMIVQQIIDKRKDSRQLTHGIRDDQFITSKQVFISTCSMGCAFLASILLKSCLVSASSMYTQSWVLFGRMNPWQVKQMWLGWPQFSNSCSPFLQLRAIRDGVVDRDDDE